VTPFSLVELYLYFGQHTIFISTFLGLLLDPEDGGTIFVRNDSKPISDYMMSHPRRQFFPTHCCEISDFRTSLMLPLLQAEFRDCDDWNTNQEEWMLFGYHFGWKNNENLPDIMK
jgi:hypothetical protein